MDYSIYREPPSADLLCQGDILDAECLRENLIGHQDYFADRPWFYRYMIVTQTCDLYCRRQMSDFIFIAVILRLREAFGIREVEQSKNSVRSLLRALYNHNYNKRGFFYLPHDARQGIEEDSVADLRVMFSIYRGHYPDLLKARRGAITDVYAAQLGHIAGYMFSRVATPGWEELNPGDFNKHINSVLEKILGPEKEKRDGLLLTSDGKCAFYKCEEKASTYRRFAIRSETGEVDYQERVLCTDHAKQHDEGILCKMPDSGRRLKESRRN